MLSHLTKRVSFKHKDDNDVIITRETHGSHPLNAFTIDDLNDDINNGDVVVTDVVTLVNGKETTATRFAYDGCHKIYLIEDDEDEKEAIELGYTIKPIKSIMSIYHHSCPLKFIRNWKLDKAFVSQEERWYPYEKNNH